MAPDNAEFRMRKACVHEALGEREEAVAEILRAAASKKVLARRWMEEEPDLSDLRDEPRLVAALESSPEDGK
jgi:hypothetical protein